MVFQTFQTFQTKISDYQGLANGLPPDEVQIGLVVGGLMQLARVPATDVLDEDILATVLARYTEMKYRANKQETTASTAKTTTVALV